MRMAHPGNGSLRCSDAIGAAGQGSWCGGTSFIGIQGKILQGHVAVAATDEIQRQGRPFLASTRGERISSLVSEALHWKSVLSSELLARSGK
jgi:hypothetical protein